MTRMTSSLVIGTLLLFVPGLAKAQVADPFMVGNKLRVTLGSGQGRVGGRVLGSDPESLTLLAGDQPVKFLRSQITSVEMSVGRRSAWVKGAAMGAALGLLLGLVVPVDENCSPSPSAPNYQPGCIESRGQAIGLMTFGGVTSGALIGAFVKHDIWAPMPLDHVRVGLTPTRHGAAMSVAVAF